MIVTSGIFHSRDVKDLPSLVVMIRIYTAIPVCRGMKFVREGDKDVIPRAGIEDSVYSIGQALKLKVEYVH